MLAGSEVSVHRQESIKVQQLFASVKFPSRVYVPKQDSNAHRALSSLLCCADTDVVNPVS